MKTNDALDSLLRSWRVDITADREFHDSVWNRIATRAEDGGNVVPIRSGLRQALIAGAAAVVLGFALGLLTPGGSVESAKDEYFARINPLSGT